MSDSSKKESRMIFVPAEFVASLSRWACSTKVPSEIDAEFAAIDKSLRVFGNWKAGNHFRVEFGGLYLQVEGLQPGGSEEFEAEAFAAFVARVHRFGSKAALQKLDPQDEEKKRRKEVALQELDGRAPEVIEKLIEALSAVKGPLQIQVGKAKVPINLAGADVPLVNRDVPLDPRVSVADRRDYLQITIEGQGSVLVARTADTESLQVGDQVEIAGVTNLSVQRCIKAVEARVDKSTQREMFKNSTG